jgi:hypothetical protein
MPENRRGIVNTLKSCGEKRKEEREGKQLSEKAHDARDQHENKKQETDVPAKSNTNSNHGVLSEPKGSDNGDIKEMLIALTNFGQLMQQQMTMLQTMLMNITDILLKNNTDNGK